MEKNKLENLKKNLNKAKIGSKLALMGLAASVNLTACSNDKTSESTKSVLEASSIAHVYENLDRVENMAKTYSKEDLKLLMHFENGYVKFNFINFLEVKPTETVRYGNELRTSYLFKFITKHKYDFIDNFDYLKDDTNGKIVYYTLTNGIALNGTNIIPDSNLKSYYGMINFSDLALPAEYTNANMLSYDEIKDIEQKLNACVYDVCGQRKEENYQIANLELVNFSNENYIVDTSKSVFLNNIFDDASGHEVYYDASITNPFIALKYEALVSDVLKQDNNMKAAYNLRGVTSADSEFNEQYSLLTASDITKYDIKDFLNPEQLQKGYLTYEEIVEIERNLNYGLEMNNSIAR